MMGIGGDCGVGQVSNWFHTAKCSIDRSLPPANASAEGASCGAQSHAMSATLGDHLGKKSLAWSPGGKPSVTGRGPRDRLQRYAEHIAWLAASGCNGITPNGSLGEYQTLTEDERARACSNGN